MDLKSYEQWWEKNLGGTHYNYKGSQYKSPDLDHFGGKWMGDHNDPSRQFHRQFFGYFKSILDAGCGGCPEYYGLIESHKDIKYTGLDITPKLVESNKSKGIDCHHGSLNDIPFKDESFDVVLSRHVVEHMESIEKPLSEMIRVAKKRVILSFFIDPTQNTSNSHIISLDEKGTDYEVYHNQYSRPLIEKLLSNHQKVFNFEWRKQVLIISV